MQRNVRNFHSSDVFEKVLTIGGEGLPQ